MKTGILLVFLSCTYTIHIARSLSLRRAMPLSYLYVYDLCFSISRPSGVDVSAKVRKIFIPASDPKYSFSATRSPRPLPEHLRSVPLSALRVQRYDFSPFPQVPPQYFFRILTHTTDNQQVEKWRSLGVSRPLPSTARRPVPICLQSNTGISDLYYRY